MASDEPGAVQRKRLEYVDHGSRGSLSQQLENPAAGRAKTGFSTSVNRPLLVSRFGEPNGFQNLLRREDSDNWIHWDFNLKAGTTDVYFAGASREIHVSVSEKLTDENWKELIDCIKADYRRVGRQKSEVKRSLEKWVVFQNKFVTLCSLCASLHERIVDAPTLEPSNLVAKTKADIERYKDAMQKVSARAADLYGDCLKLSLITPILAEAFLNLMILTFCRDKIRNDPEQYQSFVRAKIPERLELLTKYCDGFEKHIDPKTETYADFMRVINKRNFALHGNIEPIREQIETVYFDGKRPLFVKPGNNVDVLFEQLDRLHAPKDVVTDYENVQLFLLEIMECLKPKHLAFFEEILTDPLPGYDVNRKRVTRLLPNHVVLGIMEETCSRGARSASPGAPDGLKNSPLNYWLFPGAMTIRSMHLRRASHGVAVAI